MRPVRGDSQRIATAPRGKASGADKTFAEALQLTPSTPWPSSPLAVVVAERA